jgi:hypothetical protein
MQQGPQWGHGQGHLEQPRRRSKLWWLLLLLVPGGAVLLALFFCGSCVGLGMLSSIAGQSRRTAEPSSAPTPKPTEKAEPEEEKPREAQEWEAWAIAQQFVKRNLKSPSTADFGSLFGDFQSSEDHVKKIGPNKFKAFGWVDSQNSFGATVRTKWYVELEYYPDTDKWRATEGPHFL